MTLARSLGLTYAPPVGRGYGGERSPVLVLLEEVYHGGKEDDSREQNYRHHLEIALELRLI